MAFPGSERWLTEAADLRLRRWVDGGGKLASFGTDAFRRRVELADAERLLDPTPPEATNVFGERVAQRVDTGRADGREPRLACGCSPAPTGTWGCSSASSSRRRSCRGPRC